MVIRLAALALAALLAGACDPSPKTDAEAREAEAPRPVVQLGPWLAGEAAADRFSGAVIVARWPRNT